MCFLRGVDHYRSLFSEGFEQYPGYIVRKGAELDQLLEQLSPTCEEETLKLATLAISKLFLAVQFGKTTPIRRNLIRHLVEPITRIENCLKQWVVMTCFNKNITAFDKRGSLNDEDHSRDLLHLPPEKIPSFMHKYKLSSLPNKESLKRRGDNPPFLILENLFIDIFNQEEPRDKRFVEALWYDHWLTLVSVLHSEINSNQGIALPTHEPLGLLLVNHSLLNHYPLVINQILTRLRQPEPISIDIAENYLRVLVSICVSLERDFPSSIEMLVEAKAVKEELTSYRERQRSLASIEAFLKEAGIDVVL